MVWKKASPGDSSKFSTELRILFRSEEERAKFVAWWLDGGGEQKANAYTHAWNNPTWMMVCMPDEDEEI